MKTYSISQKGPERAINEDHFLVKHFHNGAVILAVADGMGGHAAGERASQIAVGALDGLDPESQTMEIHLLELVQTARHNVCTTSAEEEGVRGMGTTLTIAFVRDGILHWIHVGDSRLYLYREGALVQVTEDHTVSGLLLRGGEITEEEAKTHPLRNTLISCIGRDDFEADMGVFEVAGHDVLILSTDGLHDTLSEERMEFILGSKTELKDQLSGLVHAALSAGAGDDITVVAVEIK
jgi:protein phosphatase